MHLSRNMPNKKDKIAAAKRISRGRRMERNALKVKGGGSRTFVVECDDEGIVSVVSTGKARTKPTLGADQTGNTKFLRPGQVHHMHQPTGLVDDGAYVIGMGGIGVTSDFDLAQQGFSVKEFCTQVEGQVMWGPSFAWEHSFFREKAWVITEKRYDPVKMRNTTFEEFMLATFPQTLEMLGAEEEKKWPKMQLTDEDDEGY